tara:strand:- start:42 stop:254 length:213 start_codon:yes stop_codon:yes gene_type:complete
MKGVKYNCIIDDKIKINGLEMKELIKTINDIINNDYHGLIEMNPTKIYNLINRPKCVSKSIRKIVKVEYE